MSRRLLIISTTFFPDPGVAAVRMTQFARFLPEFGWQPMILCRHYGHNATPQALAQKFGGVIDVQYLNEAKPRPTSLSGPKKRLNPLTETAGRLLVPDSSIRFWRSVRPAIEKAFDRIQPDVVLTTSPPHSIHDVGLWLTERARVPWAADFRDPYLIDPRFQPRGIAALRCSAHRAYERAIYQRAGLIVHAIPIQARWARRVYPFARSKIATITNGFPPEFVDGSLQPQSASGSRRSIRVIGTSADEEMVHLARAVAALVSQGMDLELRILGKIRATMDQISQLLGDRVIATGPLPHEQALAEIAGADLLISYLSPERARAYLLSSKLFEFFAAGKPVVAINPTSPDRQLLRRASGCIALKNPSVDELSRGIRQAMESLNPDPGDTQRFREIYDRRQLTRQLAERLDFLVK